MDRLSADSVIRNQLADPGNAKAVIMLSMEGGPSHLDTFDPKPALDRLHRTRSTSDGGIAKEPRVFLRSSFNSRKVGQSGIDMAEPFLHMADPFVADELCIYRGCQAETDRHSEALLHWTTGSRIAGRPSIGSWISDALSHCDTSRKRPTEVSLFTVMTDQAAPQGGAANWSNGFLPAEYQGDTQFDEANWNSDLSTESRQTRSMYGLDQSECEAFGRRCLIARKMVERGARFVHVFLSGWDSHQLIQRSHRSRIASIDLPIAGLIRDLKQRGMLDETLVVWSGEFGRTPDGVEHSNDALMGRDDNPNAMAMWFAGGGVKKGAIVGGTDELGATAVECVHSIHDVHCTLMHLFGIDASKMAYADKKRKLPFSQTQGTIIRELIA